MYLAIKSEKLMIMDDKELTSEFRNLAAILELRCALDHLLKFFWIRDKSLTIRSLHLTPNSIKISTASLNPLRNYFFTFNQPIKDRRSCLLDGTLMRRRSFSSQRSSLSAKNSCLPEMSGTR